MSGNKIKDFCSFDEFNHESEFYNDGEIHLFYTSQYKMNKYLNFKR